MWKSPSRRLLATSAATRGKNLPTRTGSSRPLLLHIRRSSMEKKKQFHSTWTPSTTAAADSVIVVPPPTREELWRVFVAAAVPMVGFGFMDQSVMIHAGHLIDCTIGVTFGLSTLTAAAFGQVCSDASGVLFGGTLDSIVTATGLAKPAHLSTAQRLLPITKRTKVVGAFFGVLAGCCLGLVNLLFLDTTRSSTLKLAAAYSSNPDLEFEFSVEASNAARPNVSALTVRGPDMDGLLASLTAALAIRGCSLVELHAAKRGSSSSTNNKSVDTNSTASNVIEDVFYVVQRDTGEPFPDEELQDLAQTLLDATRTPMNAQAVTAAMQELERKNGQLQQRCLQLEELLRQQRITVVPASGTQFH